jgi:methylase of polypeptide subunit release factors
MDHFGCLKRYCRSWLPLVPFERRMLIAAILLSLLASTTGSALSAKSSSLALSHLYHVGRQIRIRDGHAKAQPCYADLLRQNPNDLTVSSRLAASVNTTLRQHQRACCIGIDDSAKLPALRDWLLASNYTSATVAQSFKLSDETTAHNFHRASAPVYVTPAAAGSVHQFPFSLPSLTIGQCLVALFLLGLCIPADAAVKCCSEANVQLLMDLGLVCTCEHDHNLLLAVVSITPIDLPNNVHGRDDGTIYVVTDWHPRVLNTIRIAGPGQSASASNTEEAVMYIGPDSLGLIEHWMLHPDLSPVDSLLDVCTGCGVQALVCLAMSKCHTAVCVDINPRALRFAAFSAGLNGFTDAMIYICGDVLKGRGRIVSNPMQMNYHDPAPDADLVDLLQDVICPQRFGMITCNPPFLPVPTTEDGGLEGRANAIPTKHGWFSNGGALGEAVLAEVLNLARSMLDDGGFAAIVSEFFFEEDHNAESFDANCLLKRLCSYWTRNHKSSLGSAPTCRAILLTNEYPISATSYATRRADSEEEVVAWNRHLERVNIAACSPGFLYLQKSVVASEQSDNVWTHLAIPKSSHGSIWTPGNTFGIQCTQSATRKFFGVSLGMRSLRG